MSYYTRRRHLHVAGLAFALCLHGLPALVAKQFTAAINSNDPRKLDGNAYFSFSVLSSTGSATSSDHRPARALVMLEECLPAVSCTSRWW
jgi:hypothetical protein